MAAGGVTLLDPAALHWQVWVWPALFGLGLYLIVTSPSQPIGRPKPDLRERLRRLDVDARIQDARERSGERPPLFAIPLLERMLRPVVDDLGRLLARLGVAGGAELERRLTGVRPGVDPRQFVGEKVVASCVGLCVFPLMNFLGVRPFGEWPAWLWFAAGAAGYLAPDWQLERLLAERRLQALMELPIVLDLLAIAASAGLALEQALKRVAASTSGVVAEELQHVARDMALGSTLAQALDAMARRNTVSELTGVVAQLRAAHAQGLPLGPALAAQAEALRERKRLRLVEIGGKATVKMVLPVALLILPTLFVVLLVPAGVELVRLGG